MTSEEDDLVLGAEAKSVVYQSFEENNSSRTTTNNKGLGMAGKTGKSTADDNTAEDMKLNLEEQIRLQTDLPHQESQNSENSASVNSLDQILEERRGDPEMILQNLGFSGSYSDVKCRIPDRFLLTPSKAYGISVEKFLEGNPRLREFLEEKSAIQNPFEMMMTSTEVPVEKRRRARTGSGSFYQAALTVTVVNRFKRLIEKGCWASFMRGGVPVAEAVVQETPRGCRYWSVLPNENRSYLESSGYYDELWSAVSGTCDPTEESKLTSFCTAERKTTSAESTSPKLLGIACDLVSKQLHRGQSEVERNPTNTKDSLMLPWSKPKGSSSSVPETEERRESTSDVHTEGNGRQFQPQPNARNIPDRFLANPSVLVPNHLMTFDESKLDFDMQQSVSEDSSTLIHVGTVIGESTGWKNDLPITESLYQEHNDNIMQSTSSSSVEIEDYTDQEIKIIRGYREAITDSATMASNVCGRSELSQTLCDGDMEPDSANHNNSLTAPRCTILETNGISQDQEFMESDDTSSTVLSVCGGDREPDNLVALPVADGLEELSSAAAIHSDAVAASLNDSLHCKSTARKERICLRDFRAFSVDVPETCSSNDAKMTSIINGQSRLRDDMIHQLSIQSGSSGFAEGDQLDVSLLSIHDALTPSNRLLNMETPRLKDASCSQCFAFSLCESPDFMNSNCTHRPFSEGSDDCFHMFSEPSYKAPHCTASTQTDSLDVSSFSTHRCFSDQNISQGAATHHGFQQNLINNGAPSKAERKATTKLDNLCASINDRSCVSGDCVNASKQYRTEVTILVNQSSMKLQNLETSSVTSPSSAYDFKKFHEDSASSSVEMDVVDPRKDGNHTSVIFRLDQSSPVQDFGQSSSTVDSLDWHQSESITSGHSSPVRYHSKFVSFQPDQQRLSVRDRYQTRSLKDSFDLQESNKWGGRVQLSPSSHDSRSASVTYERHEEHFLDVSEHQMLQDQLKNSGFVSPQSLPSFLQWPTIPMSTTPKWKQCVRDELKLMDFALRKYKLQNKLLHRRMCKAIDSSGCSRLPGVLLQDERDDLDMLEILHTEIMEELDKMEELLMQRLKRFLRSHAYEDEEHLPLSDSTSQCILHSMNQLLREQEYQSNIVNSINCTGPSDHLSDSSPPLVSSPPPLLLHSVPIDSLQQLNKCLASVETLLTEIQRKTDVIENSTPFEKPVQKFLDQNKELKRRKSYHRFLPACFKPQWPKKHPVFKQQMSLPNLKEDH